MSSRHPYLARLAFSLVAVVPFAGLQPVEQAEYVPAFSSDLPIRETSIRVRHVQCTVTAGDPRKEGQSIKGEGSQTCRGDFIDNRIKVTVQQYRGAGIWRSTASNSGHTAEARIERTAAWACAEGTGNQLYRIVTDGSFQTSGGFTSRASVQSGEYLRVVCPDRLA